MAAMRAWAGVAIALAAGCVAEIPGATGNQPPIIGVLSLSPGAGLQAGQAVTLTVGATDPEGDPIDYTWRVTGGTLLGNAGTQVTWNPPATPGRHTVQVLATDPNGGAAAGYVSLEVMGSQVTVGAPLILRPAPGEIKASTVPKTVLKVDLKIMARSRETPASPEPGRPPSLS
jgi:hypothetical protein